MSDNKQEKSKAAQSGSAVAETGTVTQRIVYAAAPWNGNTSAAYSLNADGVLQVEPWNAIMSIDVAGRDLAATEIKPWFMFQKRIPIGPGLTLIVGSAATGKSTTLEQLAREAMFVRRKVRLLRTGESVTTNDDVTPQQMMQQLARCVLLNAERKDDPDTPDVVLIDSLRFLTQTGTGYAARTASSGFDLTILQWLSDLDRLARRLHVAIVATLFLSEYQLSRGDATNSVAIAAMLNTLAIDFDGAVMTTIMLGPTRKTPGHYVAYSRYDRSLKADGIVALDDQEEPKDVGASAAPVLTLGPVAAIQPYSKVHETLQGLTNTKPPSESVGGGDPEGASSAKSPDAFLDATTLALVTEN